MSDEKKYLTVTALTRYIKRKFTADPYMRRVYLTGEISNFRIRPKHQYFSLKDENAVIDVVMFASDFSKVKFRPEEGMKVIVSGRVDVYEGSGKYQFYVETMEPEGIGALYQALKELQQKLSAEGLFSAPKKPINRFPKRIAVITSRSGAVIQDIRTTIRRRYPIAQVVLFPAVVQGAQAADTLVARLKEVNARGDFDTIIIGRGGGSIEDLWPFNEEKVARAIFDSKIPVISSVGHETDTTIADLVADVRAATPTAAAELATSVLSDDLAMIDQLRYRLVKSMRNRIEYLKQLFEKCKNSYIFMQPERLYEGYLQKLDRMQNELIGLTQNKISQEKNRLTVANKVLYGRIMPDRISLLQSELKQDRRQLESAGISLLKNSENRFIKAKNALDMLSPLRVMGRGFTYVTQEDHVIKSVNELSVGEEIKLHLQDGYANASITETEKE